MSGWFYLWAAFGVVDLLLFLSTKDPNTFLRVIGCSAMAASYT